MSVYEITERTKLAIKAKAHIFLFHWKTLNPSSIPKGMRLKSAIQALKAATSMRTEAYWGIGNATAKNMVDSAMFVAGPAIDILPILSLFASPATITAPGDIILKSGEITENSVKMAPINVNLNSAHNPFLCAVILWAISCMKKDVVKIAVNTANIAGCPPIAAYTSGNIPIDNPMPMTSNAPIVKCMISLMLKCTFPLFGSVGT